MTVRNGRWLLADLLAKARRRCNRAPLTFSEGGYHFWRCGLKRGHDGPCRTGFYWWGPGGSIYDPDAPFVAGASNTPPGYLTRRQRRWRDRHRDLRDLKRQLGGQL